MSPKNRPAWETLTFSGLQRYVMICECVINSDAFLSQADRAQLIASLLESSEKLTTQDIETLCEEMADAHLEYNMVSAQTLNQAIRGY